MNVMIEVVLQNVSKRFGTKVLFSCFNMVLISGQCYCLCGGNGVGKSTLLRCIGQWRNVDCGSVRALADGRLCTREEFQNLCGIVAPDFVLYDEMTAWENVLFFAGMRNEKIKPADIQAALEIVGLDYEAYQPVRTFSTGMKQRLKLAVLYASDVPVWLLDEPSSNLDDRGKILVRELVTTALNEGRLVVMATNEWSEREYATKCLDVAAYRANVVEGICS